MSSKLSFFNLSVVAALIVLGIYCNALLPLFFVLGIWCVLACVIIVFES